MLKRNAGMWNEKLMFFIFIYCVSAAEISVNRPIGLLLQAGDTFTRPSGNFFAGTRPAALTAEVRLSDGLLDRSGFT